AVRVVTGHAYGAIDLLGRHASRSRGGRWLTGRSRGSTGRGRFDRRGRARPGGGRRDLGRRRGLSRLGRDQLHGTFDGDSHVALGRGIDPPVRRKQLLSLVPQILGLLGKCFLFFRQGGCRRRAVCEGHREEVRQVDEQSNGNELEQTQDQRQEQGGRAR